MDTNTRDAVRSNNRLELRTYSSRKKFRGENKCGIIGPKTGRHFQATGFGKITEDLREEFLYPSRNWVPISEENTLEDLAIVAISKL